MVDGKTEGAVRLRLLRLDCHEDVRDQDQAAEYVDDDAVQEEAAGRDERRRRSRTGHCGRGAGPTAAVPGRWRDGNARQNA